ncbi:ABC transporter ATP-binding protein [Aquamicrobium sp. LC103]|uniref:ABC transporter ATP-binding protein n=1 Tax=Aquamicrobium sp. LC103 TaxID=1120658 RepID=UPI00063ECFD3|nr:ABC transporter ATP-binding protein [Aquamicrobium sp. LC103]TKT69785.1 ABC transporter ATP-binding protein [Aquamicrobium sp. LC103]
MADTYILSCEDLVRSFGAFRAVDGITLGIREGTIHALIGPNGAGKTTFFNLLTRFLPGTSGTIRFDGRDITTLSPETVADLGLIRSFQISAIFPSLSLLENVRIALHRREPGTMAFWRSGRTMHRLNARAIDLLDRVGLADRAADTAGQLSYGRKRALELATALALDPKVLLLDEPMAGMGTEEIDRIAELIRDIGMSRTILMVEHNLSVVASLAQEISVLAQGKLLAQGSYAQVSSDPAVIEAYIGSGGHG